MLITTRSHARAWCAPLPLLLALGTLLAPLRAQQNGISREAMWPAPTAEDWQRPCLITWQRTWDDALELARRNGKPILICVNMDGEIASEHYAGVRYRQPETTQLWEPYVTVIASVYRHTPRDYDQEGRRVLCPRFGSVTCGEHISIEPLLFEQFFDGRRIAPRHIGIELDRSETYDVYYAFDTDSVFQAIKDGARPPTSLADVARASDLDRVRSPDVVDRIAVENEYRAGDQLTRRRLLRAAAEAGADAPVDMLRLAVYGLDVELNRLALEALARANSESAIELINEALRVPMQAAARRSLIAALERLGRSYPRARTLAAVHRGLASSSETFDVGAWSSELASAAPVRLEGDRLELEYRLENTAGHTRGRPADPQALLELGEATLALALNPQTAASLGNRRTRSEFRSHLFEDARNAALKAERLGANGWRTQAVLALCAHFLGEVAQADGRAESAVKRMPPGAQGWNAMASLALFAQARQRSINASLAAKEDWPSEWLTDVNAAYSVLAQHPLGSAQQVVEHHDFLRRLGAQGQAGRVLLAGLERFPEAPELHARLRGRTLWEKGADGLERTYARMLEQREHPANLAWFAGYASLVAAEAHRRGAENEAGLASYARAIAHYERSLEGNPKNRESADHYVAMALAGRARIALDTGHDERALEELRASFQRKPESASSLDGLNLSAVGTAQMLLARFEQRDEAELAERLRAALARLGPAAFELPEFEIPGATRDNPAGTGARRR